MSLFHHNTYASLDFVFRAVNRALAPGFRDISWLDWLPSVSAWSRFASDGEPRDEHHQPSASATSHKKVHGDRQGALLDPSAAASALCARSTWCISAAASGVRASNRLIIPELKSITIVLCLQDALLQYMRREGIVAGNVNEIHLQQFGHGQSNPTYLVKVRMQQKYFNLVYMSL